MADCLDIFTLTLEQLEQLDVQQFYELPLISACQYTANGAMTGPGAGDVVGVLTNGNIVVLVCVPYKDGQMPASRLLLDGYEGRFRTVLACGTRRARKLSTYIEARRRELSTCTRPILARKVINP